MSAASLDFSMQQANHYQEALCCLEAAETGLKGREQEQEYSGTKGESKLSRKAQI